MSKIEIVRMDREQQASALSVCYLNNDRRPSLSCNLPSHSPYASLVNDLSTKERLFGWLKNAQTSSARRLTRWDYDLSRARP